MKKIAIVLSIFASSLGIYQGMGVREDARRLRQLEMQTLQDNDKMAIDIRQKRVLKRRPPVAISRCFESFINLLRTIEHYGGLRVELTFDSMKDKELLTDHVTNSQFKNVKSLPVDLKISGFSADDDLAYVLNDLSLLEQLSDFRVCGISEENDVIQVKGALYGT